MNAKRQAAEIIRKDLLQSSEKLLADDDALGLFLRSSFPKLKRAFVMHWIPEQTEDIYWILISSSEIVQVEVPRGTFAKEKSPLLKVVGLDEYRAKPHSRITNQRLEIGIELMRD